MAKFLLSHCSFGKQNKIDNIISWLDQLKQNIHLQLINDYANDYFNNMQNRTGGIYLDNAKQ